MLIDLIAQTTIAFCTYCPGARIIMTVLKALLIPPVTL